METKIKILSERLSNMIAAGEVVEKPASVVKELVENSIDALASEIRIDLTDCGLKCISITDNGFGMNKEDMKMALKRHATSKISTEEDLFNITSLGFRGEALPSIASVSTFRISSCQDDVHGYFYKFENSTVIEEGPCSMRKGTQIEVSDLFYNTPARLKHLKSSYTELSYILDYITKIALSHPNIQFKLLNNGKLLFKTNGNNEIVDIMAEAFGASIKEHLIYFNSSDLPNKTTTLYRYSGYTTTNAVFRSNKNAINIIINGRIVKNLNLSYAITNAYSTILPIGKYPLTTLIIECDPSIIDVNVHPSKLEVRLLDASSLEHDITLTILNALKKNELSIFNSKEDDVDTTNNVSTSSDNHVVSEEPKLNYNVEAKIDNDETNENNLWDMFDTEEISDGKTNSNSMNDDILNDTLVENEKIEKASEQLTIDENIKKERSFFKSLKYIGSFCETYLILDGEEALYLIDQHAAMERVMYEKIKHSVASSKMMGYNLLIPVLLEYSQAELCEITTPSFINELEKLGIEAESFGDKTIIVRTIPEWIPEGLEAEFVRDIIEHLRKGLKADRNVMIDSLAKSLACKKSIKANMHIRNDEVNKLLSDLDNCEMPYTCPHGRPTIIKFTSYDLEKLFKRVI